MYILFEMLTVFYKYKRLYERRCCEIMKKNDLRISDLDILFFIANSGRKNLAKDIVDIGMSKANVSKSVDHLHQKKLVVLSEDPEDRRCIHIEVAKEAAPLIGEITAIREELARNLLDGVKQEDETVIVKVMQQIGDNINMELLNLS